MTQYTIKIHYRTGNSFGSHEEADEVGYVWDTMEEAVAFIDVIDEHYKFYNALNDSYAMRSNKVTREEIIEQHKDKPWFREAHPEYSIAVGERHISTFWCGYFEQLNMAEVVPYSEDESTPWRKYF